MIGYLVNLAEALISAFVLKYLCTIRHRSFLIITTAATFILELLGDYMNLNDLPLLFGYLLTWFILVLIYNHEHPLQSALVVILNNLIIDIGATIAIVLLFNVSIVLMQITAKAIQLILSIAIIKYYRHFSYLKPQYSMPVLICLILSTIILDMIMNMHFSNDHTALLQFGPWIMLGVIALTMSTLVNLENSNKEIKKVINDANNIRSKQITYDLMEHTRNELVVLRHELTYDMLLVRHYLTYNVISEALKIVQNYLDRTGSTHNVFSTDNPILDVILSLKLNDSNNVTTMINIPYDDFYNRIEFINLLIAFLDLNHDQELNIMIKEVQNNCILQFAGNYEFDQYDSYERIRKQYAHIIMSYELSSSSDFSVMNLKLNKRYYEIT